ncbi:MAG: hypothetical protein ACRDL2_00175 [Gaiellaceae bacterium]
MRKRHVLGSGPCPDSLYQKALGWFDSFDGPAMFTTGDNDWTLNVQGSCNNLCDTKPDADEWAARNAADIAWLDSTFAEAKARRSVAVMFISQADPGWDDSDATRAPTRNPQTLAEDDADSRPLDGFQSLLLDLRAKTIDFGKPVAWVHGDSHYFRIDKPLLDANGLRVENFTRVETFGDHASSVASDTNEVQWVKALVDTHSRDVFAFEPEIVPRTRRR